VSTWLSRLPGGFSPSKCSDRNVAGFDPESKSWVFRRRRIACWDMGPFNARTLRKDCPKAVHGNRQTMAVFRATIYRRSLVAAVRMGRFAQSAKRSNPGRRSRRWPEKRCATRLYPVKTSAITKTAGRISCCWGAATDSRSGADLSLPPRKTKRRRTRVRAPSFLHQQGPPRGVAVLPLEAHATA